MIYFKLNDEISNLINLIPEVQKREITLGCKFYCNKQVIALDELQLLNKLLKQNKKSSMFNFYFIFITFHFYAFYMMTNCYMDVRE